MAYFDLGFTYASAGQYQAALAPYLQATRIDPNFFAAYFNLGTALERVSNLKGAIESYQRALRIHPDDPQTLYLLGDLYERAGNRPATFRARCLFLQVAGDSMEKETITVKEKIRTMGECPRPKT